MPIPVDEMMFLASVILLCMQLAYGLYEDQAGSFDWHMQNVGPFKTAYMHSRQPRAFVATSQNVVASLNLRDGSIAWRKLLVEDIDGMLMVDSASMLITVSGAGSKIRGWDQADGGQLWETSLDAASTGLSFSLGASEDDVAQLAIASPRGIQVRSPCHFGMHAVTFELSTTVSGAEC